jgi:nickel-type superoxide dismutase maturation protease
MVLAGATVTVAVAGALGRWVSRVEVHGPSMRPTFEPGDRLVALRLPRWWALRPGDLVVAEHPARPGVVMVKRVAGQSGDQVDLVGDDPATSTDSRILGPVPRRAVRGRIVYRYGTAVRSGGATGRRQ